MSQGNLFDDVDDVITAGKDPLSSGLEGMDDRMFSKYQAKFSAVVARLDDVGLPGPGEQYRLITRRAFNTKCCLARAGCVGQRFQIWGRGRNEWESIK